MAGHDSRAAVHEEKLVVIGDDRSDNYRPVKAAEASALPRDLHHRVVFRQTDRGPLQIVLLRPDYLAVAAARVVGGRAKIHSAGKRFGRQLLATRADQFDRPHLASEVERVTSGRVGALRAKASGLGNAQLVQIDHQPLGCSRGIGNDLAVAAGDDRHGQRPGFQHGDPVVEAGLANGHISVDSLAQRDHLTAQRVGPADYGTFKSRDATLEGGPIGPQTLRLLGVRALDGDVQLGLDSSEALVVCGGLVAGD